jgi:acyl-CoA synthetase (AMP-forming)/AMP-acid ligase II
MNIGNLLTKTARAFPDRTAMTHGPRKLTYARFNARANHLANALNHLGVRQGGNVALLQYNYPEMLESVFACFKAGYGAVPINWRLHPKEFSFIIDHSESEAVILSPEFNEPILEAREHIPNVRHLITLSGAEGDLLDYEELLSKGSDRFSDVGVRPDDLAWLF